MSKKSSSKSGKGKASSQRKSLLSKAKVESKYVPPKKVVHIYKPDVTMETITRRQMRYIMFRIKSGQVDAMDKDLKAVAGKLEKVLSKGMDSKNLNWGGFTFIWDLDPVSPPKIIADNSREAWLEAGGTFEGNPGNLTEKEWATIVVAQNIRKFPRMPAGFTKQE